MTEPVSPSRPQLRLLTLLLGISVVAIWSGVLRIVPHIAVAVLGIVLPLLFTTVLVRFLQQVHRSEVRRAERVLLVLLYILMAGSWAFGYVVSIGPALGLATYAGIHMSYLDTIYAPVTWLHSLPLLREPIEEYCRMWSFR